MELLNLKEHPPEEYTGKIIQIYSQEYYIGNLVGEGCDKLVYRLINSKSGLCHYVLRIPLDQDCAAGIKKTSLYQGKHCYDHYRWLAKLTYNYHGYANVAPLPFYADFLDIEEFAHLDNKYHGIFCVAEFINDAGDESTGGIYTEGIPYPKSISFAHLILEINLYKDSNDIETQQKVCNACQTYLAEYNENDDNIIEIYVRSQLKLLDAKDKTGRQRIAELTAKMLQIEPFFKRHIYTAASVYYRFEMWNDIVSLFERIKDVIYEPYSLEWFMAIVVHSYVMVNRTDEATKYIKYIPPDRRDMVMAGNFSIR